MTHRRHHAWLTTLFGAACLWAGGSALASHVDEIASAYVPYLNDSDARSLPLKLQSLAGSEYKFWRGSKDLFFAWANVHCADWKSDHPARVASHGDLHFGNMGTYAVAPWGDIAFGMVDFDDACVLPFQIELMQGLVTTRLVARAARLDPEVHQTIDTALLDAYKESFQADQADGMALGGEDGLVTRLLTAPKRAYERELDKFCTPTGAFRTHVRKANGRLTDLLEPLNAERYEAFARALAEACSRDPNMAALFRETDAAWLRDRIVGVALRTRIDSSGSQGLRKFLIRLRQPLRGVDHDVLIYFKQQIPTAAERQGFIERRHLSPGARAKAMTDVLTAPRPLINSYASVGSSFYAISLKEPWSDELDVDQSTSAEELTDHARRWGRLVGRRHRAACDQATRDAIVAKLDGSLARLIAERADAYVRYQAAQFAVFSSDARVLAATRRTKALNTTTLPTTP